MFYVTITRSTITIYNVRTTSSTTPPFWILLIMHLFIMVSIFMVHKYSSFRILKKVHDPRHKIVSKMTVHSSTCYYKSTCHLENSLLQILFVWITFILARVSKVQEDITDWYTINMEPSKCNNWDYID